MSMQTPLKQVRGLGAAKSGTEHFWQQRVTAIANVPLVLFLLWFIVSHLGAARADVVSSLKNPIISVLMISALASIFWHMRLGMQVVIEDYVHGHGRKLAAVIGNSIFVAVMFALAAYSILKMSFGL
jgi:succinate dehydrogenase / fumarate reductase, membrane anchor subunit